MNEIEALAAAEGVPTGVYIMQEVMAGIEGMNMEQRVAVALGVVSTVEYFHSHGLSSVDLGLEDWTPSEEA